MLNNKKSTRKHFHKKVSVGINNKITNEFIQLNE